MNKTPKAVRASEGKMSPEDTVSQRQLKSPQDGAAGALGLLSTLATVGTLRKTANEKELSSGMKRSSSSESDRTTPAKRRAGVSPSSMGSKSDYECETCSKSFASRQGLQNHVQTVHLKKRTFECSECFKKFSANGSLKRHIETVHRGERKFECNFCGKLFALKHHLKNHTHTVHCDLVYASENSERNAVANASAFSLGPNEKLQMHQAELLAACSASSHGSVDAGLLALIMQQQHQQQQQQLQQQQQQQQQQQLMHHQEEQQRLTGRNASQALNSLLGSSTGLTRTNNLTSEVGAKPNNLFAHMNPRNDMSKYMTDRSPPVSDLSMLGRLLQQSQAASSGELQPPFQFKHDPNLDALALKMLAMQNAQMTSPLHQLSMAAVNGLKESQSSVPHRPEATKSQMQ